MDSSALRDIGWGEICGLGTVIIAVGIMFIIDFVLMGHVFFFFLSVGMMCLIWSSVSSAIKSYTCVCVCVCACACAVRALCVCVRVCVCCVHACIYCVYVCLACCIGVECTCVCCVYVCNTRTCMCMRVCA